MTHTGPCLWLQVCPGISPLCHLLFYTLKMKTRVECNSLVLSFSYSDACIGSCCVCRKTHVSDFLTSAVLIEAHYHWVVGQEWHIISFRHYHMQSSSVHWPLSVDILISLWLYTWRTLIKIVGEIYLTLRGGKLFNRLVFLPLLLILKQGFIQLIGSLWSISSASYTVFLE